MDFLRGIGNFVDKLFGGSEGQQLGGAVANKITGVPTPATPGGSESGQFASDYMDKAYPGTSPWERLGSGGSPSSALESGVSTKSQQFMQNREFSQQRAITHMNNRASVIAAASPYGAIGQESALGTLESGRGGGYDTSVAQGRDRTPSEIERAEAAAGVDREKAPYVSPEAEANITRATQGNPWVSTMASIKRGDDNEKLVRERKISRSARVNDYMERLKNRGRKPMRFGG